VIWKRGRIEQVRANMSKITWHTYRLRSKGILPNQQLVLVARDGEERTATRTCDDFAMQESDRDRGTNPI